MSRATERWVENRAVYLGARLHTHPDRAGQPWYITGVVATHYGIVEVYAQGFREKPTSRYSIFRFIHRGREYSLHVPKLLTKRGLATVARRFASEVGDGQHE